MSRAFQRFSCSGGCSVEFGFSLPGRGPLATPDVVLKMATKADELRYSSLFVTDHVVLPVSAARSTYPYSPSGQFPGGAQQDYLEPLTVMGWLAHATRKIRLGTSVLVVPYRNPLLAAKMLATLDVLSGGRVILGIGVGWLAEEFEALKAPAFESRGAVTDEYVALMRRAWTTDPVTFEGRHYDVKDIHALPKPRQAGGIPIWVGGHTDAAVRRAARLGDGWHPIGMRPPAMLLPDEYAATVERLKGYARQAGRDPASITLTLRVPMLVRSPRAKAPGGDRPLFQGQASEVRADIERYAGLGVSHFVFDAPVPEPKEVLQNMERFAGEVRGKIRLPRPRSR
ncbi:MAG: LLM class F420-dependent oxidoreductase [Candidatus Rokuibacteriota bacterium]|nr:MAG: LLM class F420-dependent oxidoreductase [Candidatus Rokubacteria bacterium]